MLGDSVESDVDNNTSDLCVIVALSKAHSSGETSTLYGRKLSKDDFGGEGHPFQLTQRNSLYIWENKILAEENIRFGSVVKYRKVGNAYVYQGNTKFRRQVKLANKLYRASVIKLVSFCCLSASVVHNILKAPTKR